MSNEELICLYNRINENNRLCEIKQEIINKSRSETIAILVIIAIIIALFMFFIFGLFSYRSKNYAIFGVYIFLGIVLFFLLIKWIEKYKDRSKVAVEQEEEYRMTYAKDVIEPILKLINDTLEYNYGDKLQPSEYNDARFMGHYNIFISKDTINGKLSNGNIIKISDIKVMKETTSRTGDSSYKLQFRGAFSMAELKKSDVSPFYIISHQRLPLKTYYYISRCKLDNCPKEFTKKFDIYTNNENLIEYVLSPEIRQLLIEYRNKAKFDISIRENVVNIRVHGRQVFRPNILSKQLISEKKFYRFYNILKLVTNLSEKLIDVFE